MNSSKSRARSRTASEETLPRRRAPQADATARAGYAALHRSSSGDLDVFVRPTLENASRVLAAVRAFGFPVAELRPDDMVDASRILQMGLEPVQIHVMSAISGVSWDAWRDRAAGRCGRHAVPFLGRDSFLRNKRAAGRPKDLADIDAITPGEDERSS